MARPSTVRKAQNDAQEMAGFAAEHPWVKTLARIGLAAIGAVYILVGVLAVQLAMGTGGGGEGAPDQQSALQQINEAPMGRFILGLIALGLLGYLVWRLTEAFADLEGKGNEPKGLASRAGHAINGIVYGGIGLQAGMLAIGRGSSGSGQEEWTARFMALPLGRWLVGLAGLFVIGYGLYQLYEAWTRKYRDRLAYEQMSAEERRWLDPLSVAGLIAHGIVLGFTGFFLILAAYRFNAEEAQGLGGALDEIARQPFGPWLLGAVAIGLIGYGAYKLAQARYHHLLAR
ncbi:MAG TPA: DUF1206 domain-containing protein [Chloroflexaceae bacterium]|nr:DUF1206 domain-containing protein [Chloroflexaceae bacterium]